MQCLGLGPGDDLVRLGQLLPVIDPLLQRIVIPLRMAQLHHVQHHLGVFGIILVPAVIQGFTCPGQRHGRNQLYVKSGIQ